MLMRLIASCFTVVAITCCSDALAQETGPEDTAAATRHTIASLFQSQLTKNRNLTWDGLADQLPDRSNELTRIDFAPAQAEYFDLVKSELLLTDTDIDVLGRHGFVLKESRQQQSFPGAYYNIYTRDMPLLVTTDSILHAFHHSYDKILAEIETKEFLPELRQMLADVHAELGRQVTRESSDELVIVARDVDFYLTVARRLLDNGSTTLTFSGEGQDEAVRQIVEAIRSASDAVHVDLYGGSRPLDFTQFRVRGHYAKSGQLSNYFRCMMWLGRADCGWNIAPPHALTGIQTQGSRELQAVALLSQLFEAANRLKTWKKMDAALSFLVGRSDNLNLTDLTAACTACGINDVSDLCNPERVKRLQSVVAESRDGEQAIRSQVILPTYGSPGPAPLPQVFQLFGQRFALDSFMLSQLVHDSIEFQGRKIKRMMPVGLDVMAGLGNDLAVRLLETELRQWKYAGNLAAVQNTVSALPQGYWADNMYVGWLGAIRQLDRDLTDQTRLPQVFRTEAWRRKQLQVQLASWSELRHDTILHAKASYSVPGCEFPKAYVEPYPEFYQAMARLARRAAKDLAPYSSAKAEPVPKKAPIRFFGRNPLANTVTIVAFFERMAGHLEQLGTIAEKELRGEPLNSDETLFLQRTISQKGNVLFGSGPRGVDTYDGWYPQLMYGFTEEKQDFWQATIADVHTDVYNRRVLEVGVGQLNFCVAAIENGERAQIYVGPTYSYYEFQQSMTDRMTDKNWSATLQSSEIPDRPAFVSPILGSVGPQLEPLVQISRKGNQLTAIVNPGTSESGIARPYRITISKGGLERLVQVAPGVRHLDVSGSQLVDDDMQPLQPLDNLKAIDLSDTQITGKTLSILGGSRFLRRLAIRNTAVNDGSMELIAQWRYLETLDLRGTSITDRGLQYLHGHHYLRQLLLDRKAITANGAQAISDALPECQVEY